MLLCVGCFAHRYNGEATERLRDRLLRQEFDKIADEAYPAVIHSLGRDELVHQLREISSELKEIDPELRLVPSAYKADPSAGLDDTNFTAVDVVGKGKKVTVTIDWMGEYRMCGIGIIREPNDPGHGFRVCD